MSQQEFEQQDQQAMQLANRESQKKSVADAAKEFRDVRAMEMQRRILWTAIQVLICILVAALFVAALMDTSTVVFLANVGVLVCGMVAAVKIDRAIRRWKKEGRV
ncbi:MAG: hypothetical protein E7453_06160 [Ruminococcaceae bacterium]|nr:hypothetical protein [Oscillospiraceae bacterium]